MLSVSQASLKPWGKQYELTWLMLHEYKLGSTRGKSWQQGLNRQEGKTEEMGTRILNHSGFSQSNPTHP